VKDVGRPAGGCQRVPRVATPGSLDAGRLILSLLVQIIESKVEEPVAVRVVIWTVEILLYQIVQSPKPGNLSLQTRPLF
jgi:hypothetical protein